MLQARITAHGIACIAAFGARGFARCMAHSILIMWRDLQGFYTALFSMLQAMALQDGITLHYSLYCLVPLNT